MALCHQSCQIFNQKSNMEFFFATSDVLCVFEKQSDSVFVTLWFVYCTYFVNCIWRSAAVKVNKSKNKRFRFSRLLTKLQSSTCIWNVVILAKAILRMRLFGVVWKSCGVMFLCVVKVLRLPGVVLGEWLAVVILIFVVFRVFFFDCQLSALSALEWNDVDDDDGHEDEKSSCDWETDNQVSDVFGHVTYTWTLVLSVTYLDLWHTHTQLHTLSRTDFRPVDCNLAPELYDTRWYVVKQDCSIADGYRAKIKRKKNNKKEPKNKLIA